MDLEWLFSPDANKRNWIQPREHICLAQEVSKVWDDRAYGKEKQYTKAAVITNGCSSAI